jgi:hypothetical protein
MTLMPLPATLADTGFTLSEVQTRSLTAAAERISDLDAPLPDSVRQDTAGTVHLTWNQLGTRIDVTLRKDGHIDSRVTVRQADVTALRGLYQFQTQLQEFFAL